MKITKPESLIEFNKFIDNLKHEDNIALLHDSDADGISAAAIVSKAISKEKKDIKLFLLQDHSANRKITDNFVKKLEDNNITKLICVDINLEDFIDVNKIKIPTLVIDHHQSNNSNKLKKFTIYKPHDVQEELEDSEVCAANLAYQLFNSRIDLSDIDWIVSIGIIGDYTFKQEKEFLENVFKKYNFKTSENIYDSTIGIAVQYITFANCMQSDLAIEKALKAILESTKIEETIEKLKEFEIVDKEIKKTIDDFKKNKQELFEDLFIYFYESPYKINSPVSSIISGWDINKTIITLQKKEDVYKISARRQDKTINMSKLLNEATNNLENANGGGHIPAAGGQIQTKDLDTFINKLKIIYLKLKEEN